MPLSLNLTGDIEAHDGQSFSEFEEPSSFETQNLSSEVCFENVDHCRHGLPFYPAPKDSEPSPASEARSIISYKAADIAPALELTPSPASVRLNPLTSPPSPSLCASRPPTSDDLISMPYKTSDDVIKISYGQSQSERSLTSPVPSATESVHPIKVKTLDQKRTDEYVCVIFGGCLLSLNSGYINACCLSGFGGLSPFSQSVSGLTGTYTTAGLAVAHGHWILFFQKMGIVLAFMFGSMISALVNPKPKPYVLGPKYGLLFILGSVLLVFACISSNLHPEKRTLFYFAAAANGLQNGATSMYSGNLIRSTHLTGTSTDIGLLVGQLLRGSYSNTWKLQILLPLVFFFFMGAVCANGALREWGYNSLVVSAALYAVIGIGCIVGVYKFNDISIWQAITGTWKERHLINSLRRDNDLTDEELFAIFDEADTLGSGKVDADELLSALSNAGMHMNVKNIKLLMSISDQGFQISRSEWEVLIMIKKNVGSNTNIRDLLSKASTIASSTKHSIRKQVSSTGSTLLNLMSPTSTQAHMIRTPNNNTEADDISHMTPAVVGQTSMTPVTTVPCAQQHRLYQLTNENAAIGGLMRTSGGYCM